MFSLSHARLIALTAPLMLMLGTSSALGDEEPRYTIRYAEFKPVEGGKVAISFKEKKVTLTQLLAELANKDPHVRRRAMDAIPTYSKWHRQDATELMKALTERLKDEELAVRFRAAEAFSEMGGAAAAAIPGLMVAAKDEDALVRSRAVTALGNIGPKAKDAIPVLLDRLGDKESIIAYRAAVGLGNIGADAVPALMNALQSGDAQVREHAAIGLAVIGPEAKKAVPELKKLFSAKDQRVSRAAYMAVEEIEDMPGRAQRFFPGKLENTPKYKK